MLRALTAKQFLEWEDFARMRPFNTEDVHGEWRTAAIRKELFDLGQRLVDVILASQGAEQSKRPKIEKIPLKDFLLIWESQAEKEKPKKQKQTWQDQWRILEIIAAAQNAEGVNV